MVSTCISSWFGDLAFFSRLLKGLALASGVASMEQMEQLLPPEGSLMKYTSVEMSPIARRASCVAENQKNSVKSPLGRPNTPSR